MNKNITRAAISIAGIIAFTAVAIVFGKWWIALFGLIFPCCEKQ